LTDAVSRALQSNSAVLEGRSDLEAAHGLVVQTRAIALPKLHGASGYAHNEAVERFPFSGSETIFPLKDEWAGDIRVVQSIYEGGRIRSALRSARLIREQAVLGYNIPATVAEDIPIILTDKLEAEPYNVDLPAAIAQAMERRPELGALRKTAALRKEEITSAKSAYRPVVGIFAGYGARNSRFRNDFYSDLAGPMAGVELNWDIYDGSLTRGKVLQAKALYEKAGVSLDDAMRRVQFEVRT